MTAPHDENSRPSARDTPPPASPDVPAPPPSDPVGPVPRAPRSDADGPVRRAAEPSTTGAEEPGTRRGRTADASGRTPGTAPERETRGGGSTEVAPEPHSLSLGLWAALILGAIVLVLLLIFVIQNNVPTAFQYFGAHFTLPLGVAMLLAAIAGGLVMGLVGSVRIIQLTWALRKLRKAERKIRSAVER
ncbi:lipopolysaccharide assembly protein LapA domain-containing protein [Brachybacterium hainanense]|uniref:Lipopolysaccharide assembly protein LapA domain-containing protein n=1 Tax=Brachybacterium hainanense TaxID=1541174 RepID=A0ABV6RG49_9MICO